MPKTLITKWLFLCCIMVILMILIGGITRLTDSGLSIVEWRPLTGIFPPFNIQQWQAEFAKYQAFPEYHDRNYGMTLSEFKFIYWLEFIHRLAGRVTGLIYLLPLIYFYLQGKIKRATIFPYLFVLILFFIQGFMGWYMVKSGLINQPNVSHFRLAFHLIIAVVIYHVLFYQLMKNSFDILLISPQANLKLPLLVCLFAIIIVYIQIFFGGLVAGLDAGLVYNNFPLMGESFIPIEIKNDLYNINNWYDPVFVQFIHRIGAYSVSLIILLLAGNLLKIHHPKLNKVTYCLLTALLMQMLTGIITLLYAIPLVVALIHQTCAIILLSVIVWCYFLIAYTRSTSKIG